MKILLILLHRCSPSMIVQMSWTPPAGGWTTPPNLFNNSAAASQGAHVTLDLAVFGCDTSSVKLAPINCGSSSPRPSGFSNQTALADLEQPTAGASVRVSPARAYQDLSAKFAKIRVANVDQRLFLTSKLFNAPWNPNRTRLACFRTAHLSHQRCTKIPIRLLVKKTDAIRIGIFGPLGSKISTLLLRGT